PPPGEAGRARRRRRRPGVPAPRRHRAGRVHRRVRRTGRARAEVVRTMKITDRSDLWWKTAVVYCLDVEKYLDWNDDGIGDFEGLSHRLHPLAQIAASRLSLM